MADSSRRARGLVLHLTRVGMLIAILLLIHSQHARLKARRTQSPLTSLEPQRLLPIFPDVASVSETVRADGGVDVLDADRSRLGYVVQTSPQSDHIIGFSGPTNTLIAFEDDDRIVGLDVLSSGDTRDHVRQVVEDEAFLRALNGLTWDDAASAANVDGVSGATLTALAIRESVIHRLGGGKPSLRFPDPLTHDDARQLFSAATSLEPDEQHRGLWHVQDVRKQELGTILQTSPSADNVVGYQGPTQTLIGFDPDGRVIRIAVRGSYDNDEYVTYVREDDYFLTLFNDLLLNDLAELDPDEALIEGVSGATMTSMAVADGVILAAQKHREALQLVPTPEEPLVSWTTRDFGTALVIVAGLLIAFTRLRGQTTVRRGFQLGLIVYLGLINGDMLSQAMLVGWAQNGIPWRNAISLVLLTSAAFLVPITTRRNVYCSHLCPHGALQDLLRNRLPWQFRVAGSLRRALRLLPGLLLAWVVIVAMTGLSFSLIDIEPFDAWVFRIAGVATIVIAVVGLIASLFVPMAYCRFGCPTGALLSFVRRNAKSDRWSLRDWLATMLLALAMRIFWHT